MEAKYPNNLAKCRNASGLTQEQLAERLGCSTQAIQNYEYGLRDMRSSVLKRLSKALGCTVNQILGVEPPDEADPDTVPVIVEDAVTTERWYVAEPLRRSHPEAVWVLVESDAMDRVVPRGCLVLVDPEGEVSSGDVVAVSIGGADITIQRVYYAGDTVVLHSESTNPLYHDLSIDRTNSESPSLVVMGRVVSYTAPEGWRP